jgi:hypothetical protein
MTYVSYENILMMEEGSASETLVTPCLTTQRHIPKRNVPHELCFLLNVLKMDKQVPPYQST